ncbi:hypothetical protein GCM10016234_39540 [Tianweitania populi]|uniref:Uncharacterized protein n=1 Tax=Tianweitania populi TaxID=1607949 RepID=A0A8J3E0M8_9HYPH|nr:hypothetical protein GCM10016234_39540 [Tianweitania populi]
MAKMQWKPGLARKHQECIVPSCRRSGRDRDFTWRYAVFRNERPRPAQRLSHLAPRISADIGGGEQTAAGRQSFRLSREPAPLALSRSDPSHWNNVAELYDEPVPDGLDVGNLMKRDGTQKFWSVMQALQRRFNEVWRGECTRRQRLSHTPFQHREVTKAGVVRNFR